MKLKAYDTVYNVTLGSYPNGPKARVNYMALKLTTVDSYKISEFASDLFVSQASIHKDLKSLKTLLNKYRIQVVRNKDKTLALNGQETNIRSLMFDLIIIDDKYQDFVELCRNPKYECNGEYIFYGLDITDDEIKIFLEKVVRKSPIAFKPFSLNDLAQFIVRIMVAYLRIKIINVINEVDVLKDEYLSKTVLQDVGTIITNIEKAYSLIYSQAEVNYTQLFFLSYIQESIEFNYDVFEIKSFSDYLVDEWSKDLDINLRGDTILLENLLKHLIPVYTRVRHDVHIENKLVNEIIENYPISSKIVERSITKSKNWDSMRKEDVAFLVLHLVAALNRMRKPLNCLLIHSDGIGARLLNRQKIDRLITELKVVQEIDFNQIEEFDCTDIDVIISTVEFKRDNDILFILINNIISNDKFDLLKEIINSY